MGGRLVGAAVAGVLVFGGGVAVAGPASAVPVVRPTASASAGGTGPGRVHSVRTGLRAHQITEHSAVARHKRKARRSVVGRALDALFGWFALAALGVLLVVVLLVYALRRRRQAG
ncbi:hypothetical protein ACFC1T_32695 [Kitasatospora sp. NPDC056076]|uniref:hypothetical protein n=1 Tax=Kitasatospora sp. NPDC056076 TaxID=3345703 RepID=UPI0035D65AAC